MYPKYNPEILALPRQSRRWKRRQSWNNRVLSDLDTNLGTNREQTSQSLQVSVARSTLREA
jgi:hypothetical protein